MRNNVFYLTNEGLEKMIKEMQRLEKEKDRKLKYELSLMNRNKKLDPDYIACSDEINFIKRRLNEIRHVLHNSLLITLRPKNKEVVELGAKVTISDESGSEEMSFTIVDTPEIDPLHGKISKNSPLGSCAIGRRLNEKFFVAGPVNKSFMVKSIEYK